MIDSAPDPSPESLRRAKLFWEQAREDHRNARKKRKAKEHLESGYLSFQAALNALTVVCYVNGQFRLPNHRTVGMAGLCAGIDARFEALREACGELDTVQDRSPFDAQPDGAALAELSRTALAHGERVLAAVAAYLKEHRARMFSP
jgi:hypothetical protein